jgi:hypothetical protein
MNDLRTDMADRLAHSAWLRRLAARGVELARYGATVDLGTIRLRTAAALKE